MGGSKKSSKAPSAPKFQSSKIYEGDRLVGETYKDKKLGVITKYYDDPEETIRKQQAQEGINRILPTLGQTAPEMSAQYDQIAQSYTDQQTDAFNKIYNPQLKSLREDIGSRFGTLQNSQYFDALNDLEKNVRTPALLDIARSAQQQKTNLYNNQEAQKLQQLQALGYVLNNDQAAFLAGLQNPQQSSNSANSFNLQNYAQQLQNYQYQQNLALQKQQMGAQYLAAAMPDIKVM